MKASGCIFNTLAVFFIALSLAVCVWMGAIFMNPLGPFNPLRPPVLDTPAPPPSATPERQATDAINFPTLPPEWTATFTPRPATATQSPEPTATPVPTETVLASPVGPTATQSETPQPTRTPTRTVRPQPASATPGSYPATAVPPSPTSGGYP